MRTDVSGTRCMETGTVMTGMGRGQITVPMQLSSLEATLGQTVGAVNSETFKRQCSLYTEVTTDHAQLAVSSDVADVHWPAAVYAPATSAGQQSRV